MGNKLLILSRYNKMGASSRYRYFNFKSDLEQAGLDTTYSPLLSDLYLAKTYQGSPKLLEIIKCYLQRMRVLMTIHKYDLCLIEKELFPFLPYFIEFLFLLRCKQYIVDYDDAIFHRYDEHKYKWVRMIFSKKISTLMSQAALVIVGNDYLYKYAKKNLCSNIVSIPTVVDTQKYQENNESLKDQFTIVWIGSQSTVRYLLEVVEPIKNICNLVNGKLLVIGANIQISGVEVELVKWSEDNEVALLKSADVGIMPLSKDNWDKGKCGFKIIQYMASKVPVIASPIGVNKKIIKHNVNGFLAETSEQWFNCFNEIYKGIENRIVENAFQDVNLYYSKEFASPIFTSSILSLINQNLDTSVVEDFGNEWGMFKNDISFNEMQLIWSDYFNIFPWDALPKDGGVGADIGCGTGRWSVPVASKVKKLYLIDPSSKAINIAKNNLSKFNNVQYMNKGLESAMTSIELLDFAYSLGVLHHVPNIDSAFKSISSRLKKGAPLLVYLYHSFEDSPKWYKLLWLISDILRKMISSLPYSIKIAITQSIALIIYWPISRFGYIASKLGIDTTHFPLIYYSDKPFYFMRNDSLDRFGTKLENRFSRAQIKTLFNDSGFGNVKFSKNKPYWCASGIKL